MKEIRRLNKNVVFNSLGALTYEFIAVAMEYAEKGIIPQIYSISKKSARPFEQEELSRLKKCFKSYYILERVDRFYILCRGTATYPFDFNKLKLYSINLRDYNLDYILICSDSFDMYIDNYIGLKAMAKTHLCSIREHSKRLEKFNED